MNPTYLDAKTYGVGELITHRKLLRVPVHQRDYAWAREDVESFVDDLSSAFAGNEEYFIGLFVLVGPRENVWEVLDGQQRLATITLLYAAVRDWLAQEGFSEDAEQVEKEFLGVRQLGGSYSPRLTLNTQNAGNFTKLVLDKTTREMLVSAKREASPKSSQARLVDAALTCRKTVNGLAKDGLSLEAQAARLSAFAAFLEKKVKVVCLDVSSAANAYVIFESLNDRGHELSVWDLLRNYLFGQSDEGHLSLVRRCWDDVASAIASSDADDFLKVFWTSRFGRVQRGQLFEKLRGRYAGSEGALLLAQQLQSAARVYSALGERESEVWAPYGATTRRYLTDLQVLGSRQARPVLLAAQQAFASDEFERLLVALVSVFVRYQTVGQLRTGQLEIACAQAAKDISSGRLPTAGATIASLRQIVPNDHEFVADFEVHSEAKDSRCAYLLFALERAAVPGTAPLDPADITVEHIAPAKHIEALLRNVPEGDVASIVGRLGNKCILELSLARKLQNARWPSRLALMVDSRFELTRRIAHAAAGTADWGISQIGARQSELAQLAPIAWPL